MRWQMPLSCRRWTGQLCRTTNADIRNAMKHKAALTAGDTIHSSRVGDEFLTKVADIETATIP